VANASRVELDEIEKAGESEHRAKGALPYGVREVDPDLKELIRAANARQRGSTQLGSSNAEKILEEYPERVGKRRENLTREVLSSPTQTRTSWSVSLRRRRKSSRPCLRPLNEPPMKSWGAS